MNYPKTHHSIHDHLETPDKRARAIRRITCFVAFTAIFLLPLLLFAGENEQDVKHESGFYYTIQKGDTLWDLSQRFSDSPWVWPDLWQENSQIANPHLIYPGERIRLFRRQGIEKIVQAVSEKEAVPEAPPKEPPYYIYSPIASIGFIKKQPVTSHGVLFKAKEDKQLISEGDIVYIKATGQGPLLPGSRYALYRTLAPLTDEKTNELIGTQHYFTGVVEITKIESDAIIATVAKSFRTIRPDDLLMPFIQRSPKIMLTESLPGFEGEILISEERASIFGDDTVAFINKGKNDGIAPGQSYSIFYHEKKQQDAKSQGEFIITPVDFGTLLVLHTEPTTSTVLITQSDKSVYPGALIRSPLP